MNYCIGELRLRGLSYRDYIRNKTTHVLGNMSLGLKRKNHNQLAVVKLDSSKFLNISTLIYFHLLLNIGSGLVAINKCKINFALEIIIGTNNTGQRFSNNEILEI